MFLQLNCIKSLVKWIAFCLVLVPLKLFCQDSTNIIFNASVFKISPSLPWQGVYQVFQGPFHPGILAGATYQWNEAPRHQIFQTLQLGYFYQAKNQHGISIFTEFKYQYHTTGKFHPHAKLGLSYLRSIPDFKLYEFNESKKTYESVQHPGRAQLVPSLALGVEWHRLKLKPMSALSLEYRFWFQGPFVEDFVPFLPQTSLHLGVHLDLLQNDYQN